MLVSTFTIGTIRLDTGDKSGGDAVYLSKFTKLAPDEPAGWADVGLMELRSNKLPEATADLNRAAALAPNNPAIEKLLSILADRQGDLAVAIRHCQAAVDLAPSDLHARYALADLLQRQNTSDGNTAYQKQVEAILDREPANLVAQLNLAAIAARRGDHAALQKAIDGLQAHSATFNAEANEFFSKIKKSSKEADIHNLALEATLLQNVLKTNINYQHGLINLTRDPKQGIGDPILQFLKLPPMPAKPDPADLHTTFKPVPVSNAGTWFGAIWMDDSGKQALVYADDKQVHLPGGDTLPFPGTAGQRPGIHSILALDVNYDLKNDLCFAGPQGVKLYIQQASGKFVDSTSAMKLPPAITSAPYVGAWAMDIEADGDLDIVLGARHGDPTVLQNNGDGTWLAIHPFKGVDGLLGFVAADVEGTGNLDVAMIDGVGNLHVFANLSGGLFKELPVPATIGQVSAIAAADLKGEGRLSFILLDTKGAIIRLSDKTHGTAWDTAEVSRWNPAPADLSGSSTLLIADLDNNGGPDIIASTSKSSQIWLCGADYSYSPLTPLSGSVTSVAKPDVGGRYDLVGLDADGKPRRLVNSGTITYNWQEIRPRPYPSEFKKGKGDRRVNSFGIGGEMEARAGLLYEHLAMDAPSIHFGLGSYKSLDALRIIWPNGDSRAEFSDKLPPDASVALEHRLEESCPFLFTWNGRCMQFVTDCIWRSPLGLKINAQDTAGVSMTEDWVKISGDQLVPDSNGQYDLRITAELNETHFFDHLSMLTVDHPIGTEVFVDERFAVPPPPLKVFLTMPLKPIKCATDDNGTDVTETVQARDGKYLDTFGRGDYQGVTRDHWVEIELNDLPPGVEKQWLVCNGFIYPTNSSINVAIGQGHSAPPRGISIETPDANGKWSVARSGLGFPEGKIKTILLDLTGVFKPGAPRKLRLRTNLEIFWDAIQCADALPDTQMHQTHLTAAAADLSFRGFSQIKAANYSSPGLPVSYDALLSVGPLWRDLEGYYTRYGDVKELLQKVDDRYVIMNAGDELRLKFDAPAWSGSGFTRDYVLIGDGWVKDGDYNTTFSRTVLPLPEHGRSEYSVRPQDLEDDPVYRKHASDWQTFHTRYVSPEGFTSRLMPGR